MITAWKAAHPSVSGHQGRTGCQREYLPHDLPPPGGVKYSFYEWRDDGTTETIHEILRCRVRERAGRAEDPSLVVLDSQSVHAAVNVPGATTGRNAAKKSRTARRASPSTSSG